MEHGIVLTQTKPKDIIDLQKDEAFTCIDRQSVHLLIEFIKQTK